MTSSDMNCITITIVGEISESANDGPAQISALMGHIERAISEVFPSFRPGHPPVTITIVTLPEFRGEKQIADTVITQIDQRMRSRK